MKIYRIAVATFAASALLAGGTVAAYATTGTPAMSSVSTGRAPTSVPACSAAALAAQAAIVVATAKAAANVEKAQAVAASFQTLAKAFISVPPGDVTAAMAVLKTAIGAETGTATETAAAVKTAADADAAVIKACVPATPAA
ncbi:hypothetical protein [Amycolatopsis sp. H20-H5]|uniref:hypothetical protein n=1 Tax=Amycolatopsis sp. H20-H5 TaxID=3046309 RepID=UPI002DB6CF08|nr:hypothetical protein [Amycolatopsis sp. H20-H5]MEC3981027.1 hypothetical protein [Amycolatopsis sp. H20-H5]